MANVIYMDQQSNVQSQTVSAVLPANSGNVLIADLQLPQRRRRVHVQVTTTGALTNFYAQRSPTVGGTLLNDLAVGDFAVPDGNYLVSQRGYINRPSAGTFDFIIDLEGVGDWQLFASTTVGATVTVVVSWAVVVET